MPGYTVLALRYRPRTFADVVGQEDAARVLQHSIRGERGGHAYLFAGPRGVGKTSMARVLAKAWNCLASDQGESCGTCEVCRGIDGGSGSLDVVEIDGASHNRVENVRDLIEGLRFRPVQARYRVTIVDEVHMLSTAAFNALLKTLEEPPAHAKFILATTEPLKVPETIRSRCQVFDFRRLSAKQIDDHLGVICAREGLSVPPGLLPRVARAARGGMRDALSLLDQLIAFGDGTPTLEAFERLTGQLGQETLLGLVERVLDGDTVAVVRAVEEAFARGARPADLFDQLGELLQGLLVTAAGGVPADRTSEETAALQRLAARTHLDHVLAMLDVLVEAQRRLRQRHDGRLVAEMALLTLARLPLLRSLDELLAGPTPAARVPAPAPVRAEPAPADPSPGFFEALARSSRSLALELRRAAAPRWQGDELHLAPPPELLGGLFDLRDPATRRLVEAAASTAASRPMRLVLAAAGPAAAPGPLPGAPRRARPSADPLEQRILRDWPGAERVDG